MAKRSPKKPTSKPADAKSKLAKRRRAKVAAELTAVQDDSPALDKRWYARPDEPHDAIRDIAGKLLQDGRRSRVKFYRELYLDESRGSEYGYQFPDIRSRFNVVRNVCETLLARAGKHQPAPSIHTVGGVWKVQRRAKAMGRFIGGDWERLHADRMRRDMLLDCLIYGEGDIKVFAHQGRVMWHRVRCEDLLRHPREVKAGRVRTLYQVACVDREVLAAEYPDERHEIANLGRAPSEVLSSEDEDDDLVLVVEAWHLPHAMDDNGELIGGRHTVITDKCTLFDAVWTLDRFPVVELHMTGDTLGRAGIGYSERLAGLQAEQNRMSETASEVARLMPPKYALMGGATLMEDQVTNLPAEFLTINGPAGSIAVLSAEPQLMQLMQAAAMQRAEMYRIEGISEDSAQGTVPTNLDSGKAQLVHRDSNAERHVELIQRVEEATCELCRVHISTCEMIAESGDTDRLVAHTGGKLLAEIRYTDVSLGKNPYVVRVAPINKFANSPEGKHTQLMELSAGGHISPAEFRELYDLPDMDRSNDLAFAGRDTARQLIESALDGNDVACPRYCDKPALIELGWREYAIASMEGATDDDLVALLRLLGSADSLIKQEVEKAAAAAQAAAPPAMPAGPPMPPDVPVPPPMPPMGPIGLVQ